VQSCICCYRDSGADSISIGSSSDCSDAQHIILIAIVIAQEFCWAIAGCKHEVQIPVVIEVEVYNSSSDDRSSQRRSNLVCDLFKLAVTVVVEEERRLRIMYRGLHDAYVVGNVSVHREDIRQTVEIVVEKESSERE